MRFTKKKITAVVATTAVVALGAGAAFAYWTSTGTGTGTATNRTNLAVTFTQTALTDLYPGGPAVVLAGTLNNPNAYPVTLASITPTLTSVTGGTGTPACTTADYLLVGPAVAPGVMIAGANTIAATGFTVRLLNNTLLNQDACKSATLNITYAIA